VTPPLPRSPSAWDLPNPPVAMGSPWPFRRAPGLGKLRKCGSAKVGRNTSTPRLDVPLWIKEVGEEIL